MMKLLKYAVLGVALAAGSSNVVRAETAVVLDGDGTYGWLQPPDSPQTPSQNYPKNQGQVAPEVDPSLAVSGLALLAGSLTVLRARRGKKQ